MEALSTHLEVRMLESRISKLTPDYWRRSGDNQPYGRLYYVKEGIGSLRSHDHEYRLRPGRLYLIPPRGNLAYACSENMQIWWMHFTATLFGCVDLFDYLPYRIERTAEDRRMVEGQMLRLLQTRRSMLAADQLEATGVLLQLVAPFFRELGAEFRDDAHEDKRRFIPVLKHIDENLGRSIAVADLARIANYEKSHFSTLFSDFFGLPPMKYVNRRRIERVQLELQRSDAKLETLAREYGFHDAFHLSRTFKRHTGLSPREFRKSHRAAEP
jgi:AraC-like DNA-binding protein